MDRLNAIKEPISKTDSVMNLNKHVLKLQQSFKKNKQRGISPTLLNSNKLSPSANTFRVRNKSTLINTDSSYPYHQESTLILPPLKQHTRLSSLDAESKPRYMDHLVKN